MGRHSNARPARGPQTDTGEAAVVSPRVVSSTTVNLAVVSPPEHTDPFLRVGAGTTALTDVVAEKAGAAASSGEPKVVTTSGPQEPQAPEEPSVEQPSAEEPSEEPPKGAEPDGVDEDPRPDEPEGAATEAGAESTVDSEMWHPPLYAQALRLRHIRPRRVWCFLFLEGSALLAVVLGLAGLVTWWAVLVLPVVVAAMVKLNDVVAGLVANRTR